MLLLWFCFTVESSMSYRPPQSALLAIAVIIGPTSGCGPTIFIESDTGSTTGGDDTPAGDTANSDGATSNASTEPTSSSVEDEDTGLPDPSTTGEDTTTGDEPGVSVELGDPSPCLLGGNMLVFDGDPGDYIHPGSDVVVAASWAPGSVAHDEIRLEIDPSEAEQGLWWTLWFSSTEVPSLLEPGLYENAMRVPFEDPGRPGLSITGDGRGCNTLQGAFEVHELVLEGDALITLTATWSQHCEGGPDELRGCIHYSP